MDANWKCLGNDSFELTLVVYRRCTDGASSMSSLPPAITSDSCTNAYNISPGAAFFYTVEDITPLCVSYQKPCPVSGGNGQSTNQLPLGLERHTWKYKVYLGGNYANCCWYKIRYQLCCRSSIITTGLADADFFNEFWLNRCIVNNSPRFTSNVLLFKTTGQDVKYNLGMTDDEKDSLSYQLSAPLGGSFNSPWNTNYPLTCLNGNNPNPNSDPPSGFNLDVLTGDLSFRPMQVQSSVVKITVTEWRRINGIARVIGVTSRDMQVYIVQGNNNKLPILSSPFTYNFCAGSQTCFTIDTDDPDGYDTTRISANADLNIPGATFNINSNSSKRGAGTFCWTPLESEVRKTPYYFVARASDNHCPLYGETYRTYTVYVKPKLRLSTKIEKLSCADYVFKSLNTDSTIISSKWEVYKGAFLMDTLINTDSMNYKFRTPGIYYIKYLAANANCSVSTIDTLSITNASPLILKANADTVICRGDSIFLSVFPITGAAPYSYKWFSNNLLINTNQNFSFLPIANCSFKVTVQSSDSCKMNYTDTINVVIDTLSFQISPLKDTIICPGSVYNISPQIISGKAPFQYSWFENGVKISDAVILSVSPKSSSDYVLKLNSGDRCFNRIMDSFSIGLKPSNQISILTHSTNIDYGQSAILRTNGKSNFNWSGLNIVSNWNDSILVKPMHTTSYKLVCMNNQDCYDTTVITIYVGNVGIKNQSANTQFQIYPNPSKNELRIIDSNNEGFIVEKNYFIYSSVGRILMHGIIYEKETSLDISSLSPGIYFIKIGNNLAKIVIQ